MADEPNKTAKTKRATAKKRELQDAKKRLANRAFRSEVRSAVREFREGIAKNDKEMQKAGLSRIYSLVDKGVKKSIFKQNKASRIKARLTAYMHSQAN
jgi:small subunit ribosomal protein S20